MEHFGAAKSTRFVRRTLQMGQTIRFYYVAETMNEKDLLNVLIDGDQA